MAALQLKRMASSDFPDNYEWGDLGEICQFLSVLLMYQGDADVEPQDKAAVLPKLQKLHRKYDKEFPGETAVRCYGFLSGDRLVGRANVVDYC